MGPSHHRMSRILSKTLMWLLWAALATGSAILAHYLTAGITKLNTFDRPFDAVAITLVVFPVVVCGVLRFWLTRVQNPWFALVPFLIGMFFAQQAGFYGLFVMPEYCIVFQVLSGILIFLFVPFFIHLHSMPAQEPPDAPDLGNPTP